MINKTKYFLFSFVPKRFRKILKNFYYDFIAYPLHALKNRYFYGVPDFFDGIALETTTYCNLRCEFCPNSKYPRGLKKNTKLMDLHLIKKIINELSEIRFRGRVFLHFYGEPLTDERLPEILSYIKKKLPKNPVQINTNGFLLTLDKYKQLIKLGVDKFMVSQYGKTMPVPIKKILDYLKNKPKNQNKIHYRVFNENSSGISTRGGEIALEHAIDFERPICTYPGVALSINYAGDVMVCCNDYHHTMDVGNLKKESLMEIWKKPKYVKFRKDLRNKKFLLPICKLCVGKNEKT
ncbi:MAG: SPASM domain-containing protein [Nanoarchaeota archaeon]|nr:SPASM domain-containing protein [Nanoarchaeota archaeon]MBU1028052.1 SPASM domain-containing protein [Nanoarchaeota archaeon]